MKVKPPIEFVGSFGHGNSGMKKVEFTLKEVREICQKRPGTNLEESFENDAKEGWDEGLGMKGAQKALRKGIERERLVSLAAKVRRKIQLQSANKSDETLARSGRHVDRKRYRQGAPKCFWKRRETRRPDPVVHVGFSIAANCDVSSDVWIQRGAAVLTLLNEARKAGLSIALDACIPVQGGVAGGKDYFIATRIKEPGANVSTGILNFWVAHSAAFRRIGFRLIEEMAVREGKDVSHGYGRGKYEDIEHTEDYDLWIPQWEEAKDPQGVVDSAKSWTSTIKDDERARTS